VNERDPDLAEAADYILAERPRLDEDHVWAVLNELQDPPQQSADGLALALIARAAPFVRPKDARSILAEWRAYASLVGERDWDEED
jgi:hypothetical protein